MAKRKGSSTSQPRTRSRAANEEREAREVENTQSLQRLDKLPKDVWEKIFDELDESDMFPLALSCRYFRRSHGSIGSKKPGGPRGRPSCLIRRASRGARALLKYRVRASGMMQPSDLPGSCRSRHRSSCFWESGQPSSSKPRAGSSFPGVLLLLHHHRGGRMMFALHGPATPRRSARGAPIRGSRRPLCRLRSWRLGPLSVRPSPCLIGDDSRSGSWVTTPGRDLARRWASTLPRVTDWEGYGSCRSDPGLSPPPPGCRGAVEQGGEPNRTGRVCDHLLRR